MKLLLFIWIYIPSRTRKFLIVRSIDSFPSSPRIQSNKEKLELKFFFYYNRQYLFYPRIEFVVSIEQQFRIRVERRLNDKIEIHGG